MFAGMVVYSSSSSLPVGNESIFDYTGMVISVSLPGRRLSSAWYRTVQNDIDFGIPVRYMYYRLVNGCRNSLSGVHLLPWLPDRYACLWPIRLQYGTRSANSCMGRPVSNRRFWILAHRLPTGDLRDGPIRPEQDLDPKWAHVGCSDDDERFPVLTLPTTTGFFTEWAEWTVC